jgi:hypothetical protein
MSVKLVVLFLSLFVAIISVPMLAHHGTAAYDFDKTVTLTGSITSFEFLNPHVRFSFDAKDEKGKVENWAAELPPPSMIRRLGWNRESIKVGDKITITGHPAKNGSKTLQPMKIQVNGEELKIGGGGDQY